MVDLVSATDEEVIQGPEDSLLAEHIVERDSELVTKETYGK